MVERRRRIPLFAGSSPAAANILSWADSVDFLGSDLLSIVFGLRP